MDTQAGREEDGEEGEGQVLEAPPTLITPGVRMKVALGRLGGAGQGRPG